MTVAHVVEHKVHDVAECVNPLQDAQDNIIFQSSNVLPHFSVQEEKNANLG